MQLDKVTNLILALKGSILNSILGKGFMFLNLRSIEEVEEWLKLRRIDTSQWGSGSGLKSICDLWEEIMAGESEIEDNPPIRIVRVVKFIIRKGARILIEAHRDPYGAPLGYCFSIPSEKIKRGEVPIEAVIRGLKEELNVPKESINFIHTEPNIDEEFRESKSYPGLYTKYELYLFDIEVNNLPNEPFYTNETHVSKHLSPIKHHWLWI